ncbi:MAG: CBS domain-containing protein [Deltaproteobacteria bacterium]|nr:CBS domain-containing protein [Deltaproteobacteria bacterium]
MYDFIYYQVRDVMTTDIVTVDEEVSIGQVSEIFEKHDFNGLPVLGADGSLKGMITKLGMIQAFVFTDKIKIPPYENLMKKTIKSIMTSDLATVDSETPLTRLIDKMVITKFKSFPVVDEGRLVGIVSREDVLKALVRAAKGQPPDRLVNPG